MIHESGTSLFAFKDSEPDARMEVDEMREVNRMTHEDAIKYAKGMLKNGGNQRRQDFVEVAVDALEKQIPKKPKDKGGYNRCLGCANHVDMYYTNYSGTGDKVLIEYCPMCGQAILWEDVNYCSACGQRINFGGEDNA